MVSMRPPGVEHLLLKHLGREPTAQIRGRGLTTLSSSGEQLLGT